MWWFNFARAFSKKPASRFFLTGYLGFSILSDSLYALLFCIVQGKSRAPARLVSHEVWNGDTCYCSEVRRSHMVRIKAYSMMALLKCDKK